MIEVKTDGIFDLHEWNDIIEAASERGIDPIDLIRTAVLDDLHR